MWQVWPAGVAGVAGVALLVEQSAYDSKYEGLNPGNAWSLRLNEALSLTRCSTFPGFKLTRFVYIICFLERINSTIFNRDTCSHLMLCLHLMLLHHLPYDLKSLGIYYNFDS